MVRQLSQGLTGGRRSFSACPFVHSCLCAWSEIRQKAAVGQGAKKLCSKKLTCSTCAEQRENRTSEGEILLLYAKLVVCMVALAVGKGIREIVKYIKEVGKTQYRD